MLSVGGLFDGVGLLAYGLHRAGLQHAWLCEVDPWRRSILNRRWPGVPVFDDVRAVDAHAERVDVIAGGFPCKGVSTAGKQNGFDHPETVLWREMARAVGELRPRYVIVENVANILALHDGAVWGEVLGNLAALGYSVEWDCLPAAAVGAPHLRDRVFAVATHADGVAGAPQLARDWGPRQVAQPGPVERAQRLRSAPESPADAYGDGLRPQSESERGSRGEAVARGSREAAADAARDAEGGPGVSWGVYEPAIRRWEAIAGPAPEPLVRRVDDRRASRVERFRLSALGDGVQVQVGELVGLYVVECERRRRMSLEAAA